MNSPNTSLFNQLAKDWWDTLGPMKALHAMNTVRMQFIQDSLDVSNKLILDVGCGGGILTESLAKQGAIVTGIDIAGDLVDVAMKHALEQDLKINYLQTDIERLTEHNNTKYDAITCMELLEHVDNPLAILSHCSALLKPKGKLFISTLNRTISSYLLGIIATENVLDLVPKDTHDHAMFIKPSEMSRMLRKANFKDNKLSGVNYNPFNNECMISKDVSINYLVEAELK